MIFFSKIFFLFHKISHQQVADISSMISKKKKFLIFFQRKTVDRRFCVDDRSPDRESTRSLRGIATGTIDHRSIDRTSVRSIITDRESTRSLRGIATGTIDHRSIDRTSVRSIINHRSFVYAVPTGNRYRDDRSSPDRESTRSLRGIATETIDHRSIDRT